MSLETPARIAILGAGPVGLEAALYARYLGYEVEIFERGRVADTVLQCGHVRMFTPFGLNSSPLGRAALRAQDPRWTPPADDELLTGRQYAERYLLPLSASDLLAESLHEHVEVLSVGRRWFSKAAGNEQQRESEDLRLLVRDLHPAQHGRERYVDFDAVIDATGTFGHAVGLGEGGLAAIGERTARTHIEFGVPDVQGAQHGDFAGRNTLLIGSCFTAALNMTALAEVAAHAPDTWITWLVPPPDGQPPAEHAAGTPTMRGCPLIPGETFPERERVLRLANRLAQDDANHVTLLSGSVLESVAWHADLHRFTVRLAGEEGELEFDRIIANVDRQGDVALFDELQVELCPRTGAPRRLVSALAGFQHLESQSAPSFAAAQLVTGEPDFYVLGAKSYGRDHRFLIAHGLQQIRALFTLIGDRADLDLYSSMEALSRAGE